MNQEAVGCLMTGIFVFCALGFMLNLDLNRRNETNLKINKKEVKLRDLKTNHKLKLSFDLNRGEKIIVWVKGVSHEGLIWDVDKEIVTLKKVVCKHGKEPYVVSISIKKEDIETITLIKFVAMEEK